MPARKPRASLSPCNVSPHVAGCCLYMRSPPAVGYYDSTRRRHRTVRMQAGKNAMASVKETAGNVAASAKAGMDKTTATVQEKVEKMTAHTPTEKAMAEERKQEKVREAEINKQETMQQNAAAQQQTRAAHDGGHVADPGVYPVGGAPGEVAT
ncbi:hypothetical protein BHE74_00015214 [Ensete ventricosum]|nr:hypothetical protein BHE74_00015214 [Ensete ventricosum]RZS08019.1 hypothetical protein BHM03_00038944 [Ensete ventricosum]